MKIVITGATSMIGQALCKKLADLGHEIYAVVRNVSKSNSELCKTDKIHIIVSEMNQYDSLDEKISVIPDVACLLAWEGTRGDGRNNDVMQKSNYVNSMNAIRCLKKMGCHKIVIAGSQAEYGPWYKNEKQTEKSASHPNTAYGIYKLKLYEGALEFCEKNDIKLYEPRIFSLYGPNDFEGTMVMSVLKKMKHNEPCELTQCIQQWDFLYISDAVEGLLYLIEEECEVGIYNLGYGESYQLKTYIELMRNITNSSSKLEYGEIPYPIMGMVNINPDVSKLKALGWRPRVSFEQGIKEILKEKNW